MRLIRTVGFVLVTLSGYASAEPSRVTVDGITVQIDPSAPVLACAVLQTSGDPARDTSACTSALANAGAARPSMTFQPDETGRFVSCRPTPDAPASPDFQMRCARELERIHLMRAMEPIGIEGWIRPSDVRRLPSEPGRAMIRIGVDERGRPSYCFFVEPRDQPQTQERLCAVLRQRARFRPALDMNGRPMVSAYNYPLRWAASR